MNAFHAACLLTVMGLTAMSPVPQPPARESLSADRGGEPGKHCPNHEAIDIGGGYVISAARCGDTYQAWLVSGHNPSGSSRTPAILDHMTIRSLAPTEMFSIGPYCYRNGKSIYWLAIYKWNGKKKISKGSGGIVEAWVPNRTIGRFEPASRALIASAECHASDDE